MDMMVAWVVRRILVAVCSTVIEMSLIGYVYFASLASVFTPVLIFITAIYAGSYSEPTET